MLPVVNFYFLRGNNTRLFQLRVFCVSSFNGFILAFLPKIHNILECLNAMSRIRLGYAVYLLVRLTSFICQCEVVLFEFF